MISRRRHPADAPPDIIGDVQGHAEELKGLLDQLGYRPVDGTWKHPRGRVAVFPGNLTDGGPHPREVLKIVSGMMDAGAALCVMGSDEFDAILHYTQGPGGKALRELTAEQSARHEITRRTLVRMHPAEWTGWVAWMKRLPLWISTPTYRVVHACWNRNAMGFLIEPFLNTTILTACASNGPERCLIDLLLHGPVMNVPEDAAEGGLLPPFRLKWWASPFPGMSRQDACADPMPPELGRQLLPETEKERLTPYCAESPTLFIGHYGQKEAGSLRVAENVICVDADIARGGRLAAWRMDAVPFFAERNGRRTAADFLARL